MGLIVPIGQWVLSEACTQGRLWNNGEVNHPICVSVNLSSREIGRKDLCRTVAGALRATGLPSGQLELELTESGIMRDEEAAVETLRELNGMGVRLSIDDFGTGYSSLSRLKSFPIDALKIDRSFVKDLTSDPSDAAIVTGIITMAHGMGLRVVGEGVETAQQMADLTVRGCDEMQGFYFSPPESAQALAGVLAQPPNWACA
jgi:EAL domain-containing protein (putative c-di-GMP-specific phosphodiesterase class I)